MAAAAVDRDLSANFEQLNRLLSASGPSLLAYSGGVDSAFLAWAGARVLGTDLLALIADSPSLPRTHLQFALDFAKQHAIACEVIRTDEIENPAYRRNDGQRCFHCKDTLFRRMEEERRKRPHFQTLLYGVNASDSGDFRPGHAAAGAHGVRAPLLEAGLTKTAIRELARQNGLSVWDRPAAACLASRVAYGIEVDPNILRKIELGEEALHDLGFRQCRVRYHNELARLEIARDELPKALSAEMFARFEAIFKALGFRFVTLDVEGFRSGSMNALLPLETLAAVSPMPKRMAI